MQSSDSQPAPDVRVAAILIVLLAVFVAGAYLVDAGEAFRAWWVNGAWTLGSLAAGARSLHAARHSTGSDARAFALIGAGSLSFFAGMLVWSYYELIAGIRTPFPALSDAFFLLAAPLYAGGLLLYRPAAFRVHTSFTQLGNLGLVAGALLIAVPIHLHAAVVTSRQDILYVATALAWAGLYLLPALFGLVMLTVYDWGRRMLVLGPLVLAFVMHAVVDVLYARQLLLETFITGGGLDVLWLMAFTAEYWAAHCQQIIARAPAPESPPSRRAETLEALLPSALVALILLSLVLHEPRPALWVLLVSLLGAGAFTASLGLRDLWIRRADARLREAEASAHRTAAASERRLRTLFEQSANAIFVLDHAGRIQDANQAAASLTKLARDTLPGRDIEAVLGLDRALLAAGCGESRDASYREVTLVTPSDPALPSEISVVALSSAGEPALTSLVVRDLREHRVAEARRLRGQRLEAVGQLTGGIAHDFNNLLTVILGNAELLAEHPHADPRSRELARMTRTAAERGADLVRRLLAFSRRQPLVPVAVDVEALVAEMAGLLHRALDEHVEIRCQAQPDLWRALADPTQLESALLNLCLNARDAMPGGGRLTLHLRNVAGGAGSVPGSGPDEEGPDGDCVCISVADSGTGMPDEVAARAFEPFFTTKDVGAGSGLGLSMVYGFARQSGGQVRIESAPGQGTTVHLCLPRAEP